MLNEAPDRVSVPGPSRAHSSYPNAHLSSSDAPDSHAEFIDTWPGGWLTPDRARSALVRAARHAKHPLEFVALCAAAGVGHVLGEVRCRALVAALCREGELLCERRQSPTCLWVVIEVYWAPKERAE
jgi:hypothetical protein